MSYLPDSTAVILCCGGKGGVGKSTVAANLAVTLAKQGRAVGLLDADLQGPSLPLMFGAADRALVADGKLVPPVRHGVRLMSAGLLAPSGQALAWKGPVLRGALKQLLRDVAWRDLDVLVIDTPPGTGDVHLALADLVHITGAVVVSTPQRIARADTDRCITMLGGLGIAILALVTNMAHFTCPNCAATSQIFIEDSRDVNASFATPSNVHHCLLPLSPGIADSGEAGVPIVLTDAGRRDRIDSVFETLADHLRGGQPLVSKG